jgi:hypothetical protein
MTRDNQFPMTRIATTTVAMITPVILNKRTRLLQYLQTSDGHHGISAMKRNPMLVNQRTEHRSLSDFSFLQLAQVNMVKPRCCLTSRIRPRRGETKSIENRLIDFHTTPISNSVQKKLFTFRRAKDAFIVSVSGEAGDQN